MSFPNDILTLIERERLARKEAERLLESKSRELYDKKTELEQLNSHLEEQIADRTEKIKKREDQLSVLFNYHPFPAIVYDTDSFNILLANDTAQQMYGYSHEEFCSRSIFDLHPKDEIERLNQHLKNVKSGKSKPHKWTHILKDNSTRVVEISGNAIEFGDRNARIVTIVDVTEKTQIQEKLLKQERQFKDLVEKTSDVIYRTDIRGNFIYVNPNCVRISGYTEEELTKLKFTQLISDRYKERVANFYRYQSKNKIPTTKTEFPIIQKNGDEVWLEITVDLIPSANEGEPHEFVSVARDITEKRTLEKNLIRSEEKYRSIMENMELGLLEVDNEDRIIRAYPKFCKLTGYSEDELIGNIASEIFLDDDMIESMSQEKAKRKTGETSVYELQLKKKDGSKIWVMISGAPYYDEKNKIVGSVGVHLDISERKEIESQLELLSQFPELNPYPVLRFGLSDHELIYANTRAKKFLNYIEFDRDHLEWEKWMNFIKGRSGVFSEFVWNDRTYRFNRVAEPHLDIANIYSTDITEIRELQNELRHAKDKAEILSKSKDLFLANMSHEIRTPMNAIIGLTEVLSETNLNDFQYTTLNKVRSASDNLLHLINEILDLSKIESNVFKLTPSFSALNKCATQCFELYENEASKKDVIMVYKSNLSDDTLHYYDRNRLNQVVTNLLGNALKFTERGQVILELKELGKLDNNRAQVQFSITDTGIGIPPGDLEKIFDNFNQAENNDETKYGGTGLGLSIAKKILEMMDSNLSVSSELGEGSTFSFTLELDTKKVAEAVDPEGSKSKEFNLSGMRILIAEDNPTNQFLLETVLKNSDAVTTTVSNGLEALEILESDEFDLILMDMRMPKLDGIKTSWTIRNKLQLTSIPIIALTANTSDKDKEACLDAGMNAFVVKPFKPDDLLQIIQKNLDPFRNETLIDQDKLDESTFNDPDFKARMIKIFINDTTDRIREIEEKLEEHNYSRIKDIIHSIKPSLHHITKDEVIDMANGLEKDEIHHEDTFIRNTKALIGKLNAIVSELS